MSQNAASFRLYNMRVKSLHILRNGATLMFKKFFALVMCLVLMCGVGVVANAQGISSTDENTSIIFESFENQIQPRYSYTNKISCALNNSSGKAQCVASVMGYSGTTTKIVINKCKL